MKFGVNRLKFLRSHALSMIQVRLITDKPKGLETSAQKQSLDRAPYYSVDDLARGRINRIGSKTYWKGVPQMVYHDAPCTGLLLTQWKSKYCSSYCSRHRYLRLYRVCNKCSHSWRFRSSCPSTPAITNKDNNFFLIPVNYNNIIIFFYRYVHILNPLSMKSLEINLESSRFSVPPVEF